MANARGCLVMCNTPPPYRGGVLSGSAGGGRCERRHPPHTKACACAAAAACRLPPSTARFLASLTCSDCASVLKRRGSRGLPESYAMHSAARALL